MGSEPARHTEYYLPSRATLTRTSKPYLSATRLQKTYKNSYKQGIHRHQTPPQYRNAASAIRPIMAKRDVIHKTGRT